MPVIGPTCAERYRGTVTGRDAGEMQDRRIYAARLYAAWPPAARVVRGRFQYSDPGSRVTTWDGQDSRFLGTDPEHNDCRYSPVRRGSDRGPYGHR